MFKALFRRGERGAENASAAQKNPPARTGTTCSKSEPMPEAPVQLVRQQPLMAHADYALMEEDNQQSTIEADLENVFAAIRARDRALESRRKPQEDFAMVLAIVEKFTHEVIEFGPETVYHTPVWVLVEDFSRWARASKRRNLSRESFTRAMTVLLEWHGGHQANHLGVPVFVGCRVREDFDALLQLKSRQNRNLGPKTPPTLELRAMGR